MTEIKQQALDKMLVEMSKPHDETIDEVHNFLCEQDDDELFTGILREGKTIHDAMNYLVAESQKRKLFRISDAQGYRIMKEYFLGEATKVAAVGMMSSRPYSRPETQTGESVGNKNGPTQNPTPKISPVVEIKPEPKPKKAKVEMSMSIFDFIDEPINAPEHDKDESDDGDIEPDE